MNKDTFDIDNAIQFLPDIVIEREFNDGKSIWNKEIKTLSIALPKIKTAVWLIDTHISYKRHKEYMKNFDYVFFAISKYAEELKGFWLPLCYPCPRIQRFSDIPIHRIGFVGRWGGFFEERSRKLALLKQLYEDDFFMVTDYNTVYQTMAKCKIMFNCSIGIDMNYRVFEALGTGNMLVTNDVPDLHKIKGLSDKIFIYKHYKDLVGIISNLLEVDYNEKEKNIKFIEDYHLLPNRIQSMLKMIESGKQEEF